MRRFVRDMPGAAIGGLAALAALAVLSLPDRVSARDDQGGTSETPAISTPAPIAPPPLASGPIPDLELVFTSEVAGWIEPCG